MSHKPGSRSLFTSLLWLGLGVLTALPVAIPAVLVILARRGVIPPGYAGPEMNISIPLLAGFAVASINITVLLRRRFRASRTESQRLRETVARTEVRERQARESERQYRVLFEDAMQTAYADLDRLNQDLRKQKDYLQAKMEEQDRTEVELRQSEERWRQLVERNPEGIIITRGRRILYANGVATVFVSDKPEDVIGHSILEFLPRDVWEVVEARIRKQIAHTEADPIQFPIRSLDGTLRWIEVYTVPIKYRGRSAAQTVIRDVTQRRIAEEELLKYTDRIAALHRIAQGILSDDTPHTVAENAIGHLTQLVPMDWAAVLEIDLVKGECRALEFHATTGSTLQAARTGPIREFGCAQPTAETPEHLYRKSIRTARTRMSGIESMMYLKGVRSYIELPLVIKNEWVGVIYVGSIVEDGFGEDDCDVAVDIAKMIAVSMHQQRIEAERLSYETELLGAKEHAEEMARLKTTFLTNMSHEIRTPLTGIIGWAQVLASEISGEQAEFVNLIEQSGRRLLDTINSVLDLARLESNRMKMSLEPVQVAEEVRRTARLLEPLADSKNLYLRVDADEDIVCNLDRTGLSRIINNLVGNAIKFTDKGGVDVRVSRAADDCLIQVIDTGVGISREFLPFLFDEFRQESTGADRSHEGSGMGLAITRKLVEIMGGSIGVSSDKGRGTKLTVRFSPSDEKRDDRDRPPSSRTLTDFESLARRRSARKY